MVVVLLISTFPRSYENISPSHLVFPHSSQSEKYENTKAFIWSLTFEEERENTMTNRSTKHDNY